MKELCKRRAAKNNKLICEMITLVHCTKELTDPLHCTLKFKCQASEFLRTCMARDTMPKGININVPLKVTDAPTDLQQKWNDILTSCSKQLMLTLIKFHQGQVQQHEHLAETTINDTTHMIIPEYITTVPDVAQLRSTTCCVRCPY